MQYTNSQQWESHEKSEEKKANFVRTWKKMKRIFVSFFHFFYFTIYNLTVTKYIPLLLLYICIYSLFHSGRVASWFTRRNRACAFSLRIRTRATRFCWPRGPTNKLRILWILISTDTLVMLPACRPVTVATSLPPPTFTTLFNEEKKTKHIFTYIHTLRFTSTRQPDDMANDEDLYICQ